MSSYHSHSVNFRNSLINVSIISLSHQFLSGFPFTVQFDPILQEHGYSPGLMILAMHNTWFFIFPAISDTLDDCSIQIQFLYPLALDVHIRQPDYICRSVGAAVLLSPAGVIAMLS